MRLFRKRPVYPVLSVQEIQKLLVRRLTDALTSHDFKRDSSGTTFHRKRGELVHVINLQGSPWNQGTEATYYVNLAVFYAPAYEIEWGNPAPDSPKEYHGQLRNRVKADEHESWSFSPGVDSDAVADKLVSAVITRGVPYFEGVDTPQQLVHFIGNKEKDFMITAASRTERAIILSLLGDKRQAQVEFDTYFKENTRLKDNTSSTKRIKRRYACIAQKIGVHVDFPELAGETCVSFYIAMKGKQPVNDERRTRSKLDLFLRNLEKKDLGYLHTYGQLRKPGTYRVAFCTKDPAYVAEYITEREDKFAGPLRAIVADDEF